MNWKIKSLLQNIFSYTPLGEEINYLLQKHVTKNLPIKQHQLEEKLSLSENHINNYLKYSSTPLSEAIFYEFGAGWDLVSPLIFYALGINHQICVDIRPLVRLELINHSISLISNLKSKTLFQRSTNLLIQTKQDLLPALLQSYGIEYYAPCDARKTNLSDRSIHCITSTNTLEHIPRQSIQAILKECHRILKSDGILSFRVDYQDHYSYFDKNISVYNFLTFSNKIWDSFFNPALHYQNRLRHKDYLQLFEEAGFQIVEEQTIGGGQQDIKTIETLQIAREFHHYRSEELAIRGSCVVMRKANG